jgi:hypothetical protein
MTETREDMLENLNKYSKLLFTKPFRCIADLVALAIIQKEIEIEDADDPFLVSIGYHPFNMGVTRVETNNSKRIIEAVSSLGRGLGNLDYLEHIGGNTTEYRSFTIVQMAEIISKYGSFELTSPNDGEEIIFIITKFLELDDLYKRRDLHYRSPPDEDKEALTLLVSLINRYMEKAPSRRQENHPKSMFNKGSTQLLIKRDLSSYDDPRTKLNPLEFKV